MATISRLTTIPPEIDQQIKEAAKAQKKSVSAFLRESALEQIAKAENPLPA